jgi:hypothetical protein
VADSHFSHFDKIPLAIFDFTPRQRKPSIHPGTGSGGRVTQIDRQTSADHTEHDKKTVASRLLSVFQFKNCPSQNCGCLRVFLSLRTIQKLIQPIKVLFFHPGNLLFLILG